MPANRRRNLLKGFAFASLVAISAGVSLAAIPAGNQPPAQQQPPKQPVAAPPVDESALTKAKADAAAAHAAEKAAQTAASEATHKLQISFDAKPEVKTATKAVADAKQLYDDAVAPVTKALAKDKAYLAAEADVTKAQDELTQLKSATDATPTQRQDAAKKVLDARSAVSKMKDDALAKDPKIADAKTKYDAARAELAKLHQAFETEAAADPEVAAARDALKDAKAKTKEADAAVAQAQKDFAAAKVASAQAAAQQKQQLQQQQQQQKNQQRRARSTLR